VSERTVGRDRELQSLSGALDVLDEGAHAVIALVGEPGIGKSRLLRELADEAEERGITVRAARAAEFEPWRAGRSARRAQARRV
jgi:predicted ATPase